MPDKGEEHKTGNKVGREHRSVCRGQRGGGSRGSLED